MTLHACLGKAGVYFGPKDERMRMQAGTAASEDCCHLTAKASASAAALTLS